MKIMERYLLFAGHLPGYFNKPKSVNRNQKTPSSKSSPSGRRPLFPLSLGEGQGEGIKFS